MKNIILKEFCKYSDEVENRDTTFVYDKTLLAKCSIFSFRKMIGRIQQLPVDLSATVLNKYAEQGKQ